MMHHFVHNQEDPSGSHVRVQLLTLKVSTGHFGVTSFACFHQAHTGLSKNVTISLDFGSDPGPCSIVELWFLLDH